MNDVGTGEANLNVDMAALISLLRHEKGADLIAILPHLDPARFRTTGDAIRVYRTRGSLLQAAQRLAGRCLALEDLAAPTELDCKDYGPCWFGFLALEPRLTRFAPRPVIPLGPALYEAGQAKALADTAWLLARDLRERAAKETDIDSDRVTVLALRALAMGELRSPTGKRPGRYEQSTDYGRADAMVALASQMKAAAGGQGLDVTLADYWRGLHAWYAGTDPFAPTGPSVGMLGALRAYLERAAPDDPHRPTAEALLVIGGLVWGGDQPPLDRLRPPGDRVTTPAAWLAAVADDSVPLAIPSPLLLAELAEFARRRIEVEQGARANGGRPDESAIGRFIEWLGRERTAVRLPIHELGLLRHLWDKEEVRLRALRDALSLGVQIRIRVRTPHLDQGRDVPFEIEVRNQGAATAHDFEIKITVQDGDQPCRDLDSRPPVALPPGILTPPIICRVQALGPSLWIRATWHFQDGAGQERRGDQAETLEVRSPPRRPWTMIAQPYQAGIPVFGPGHFFGREPELMKVFSILLNPELVQPLLLRGPRRMGKTSLLKQIQLLLLNPAKLRAYPLDPGQIETLAQTCPVFFSLQELGQASGHAAYDGFFRTLLARVRDQLGDTAPVDPAESGLDAVRAFEQALAGLLDHSGRRLLILLDEWDETARPDLGALSRNLRSLVQSERRVNWIISSTWIKRHEGQESASPLHNVCDIREIAEFDWETACKVLRERADTHGLYWHGDAVVAAVEQTGQWPFFLQMLGAAVVDDLNLRQSPLVVSVESVHAVSGRMVRGDFETAANWFASIFAQKAPDGTDGDAVRAVGWLILWVLNEAQESRDRGELSLDDLQAAVQSHAPGALRGRQDWTAWLDAEFKDQIELLEDIQYAISKDTAQRYRIRVPIFGAWFGNWARGSYQQTVERISIDMNRNVVNRRRRQV